MYTVLHRPAMWRGVHRPARTAWAGIGLVLVGLVTVFAQCQFGPSTLSGHRGPALAPAAVTSAAASAASGPVVNFNLTVTLNITPNPAVAGQILTFSTNVTGGIPPYTYHWAGLPPPCPKPATNVGSFTCIASGYSSSNVTVNVDDATGANKGLGYNQLTVRSAIAVTLNASSSPTDAGIPVWLNVSVSGGTPPYSYSWVRLPSHCTPSPPNASSVQCTPVAADAGAKNITVTVKDASSPVQLIGSTKLKLVIEGLLSVTPGIDPTSGTVPFQVHLTVLVHGGLPPYSISWAFSDGGIGSGSPWTHTFTVGGIFNVTLSVNDSAGGHYFHRVQINAVGPPPKPGFLGLSGHTGYYVLGAVVGGIALIVIALLIWRRGRQKSLGPARAWTGGSSPAKGVPPAVSKPPTPPVRSP